MKKLLTKLTITLMAAGTLYATSATASADVTPNTQTTSSTLVSRVNHDTDLATRTVPAKPAHDLTPRATKLATQTLQTKVLETVDSSSQSLDKMKYQSQAG